MQEYETEIHIVPDTEEGHILSLECFCKPFKDKEEPKIIIHRDELVREIRNPFE